MENISNVSWVEVMVGPMLCIAVGSLFFWMGRKR
jgi:hypothetical protein